MSKKPTTATALMERLTGTNQPIVDEPSFEQIKEENLTALRDLRTNALHQLSNAAQLGLCVRDPAIAQSSSAGRAAVLVGSLTADIKRMSGILNDIHQREEALERIDDVADFVPLALQLGEEHHVWNSDFSTGVLPILEEIQTIIDEAVSAKETAHVAE